MFLTFRTKSIFQNNHTVVKLKKPEGKSSHGVRGNFENLKRRQAFCLQAGAYFEGRSCVRGAVQKNLTFLADVLPRP